MNILKVKGRSDLFLKLEIYKKAIVVISVVIALQFGIIALLYGQVITSILNFFINTHYSGKFIGYNSWQQAKDIFPAIFLASITGAIVYLIDVKIDYYPDFLRIILGMLIGMLIYIGFAFLLKLKSLNNIKKLILKK